MIPAAPRSGRPSRELGPSGHVPLHRSNTLSTASLPQALTIDREHRHNSFGLTAEEQERGNGPHGGAARGELTGSDQQSDECSTAC